MSPECYPSQCFDRCNIFQCGATGFTVRILWELSLGWPERTMGLIMKPYPPLCALSLTSMYFSLKVKFLRWDSSLPCSFSLTDVSNEQTRVCVYFTAGLEDDKGDAWDPSPPDLSIIRLRNQIVELPLGLLMWASSATTVNLLCNRLFTTPLLC